MGPSAAQRTRLDVGSFRRLRTLVNQYSGLMFDDEAMYIFERRLAHRVHEVGASSFEEYVQIFESRPSERNMVYFLLTTKETYFFRQEYQFDALMNEVVPRLAEALAKHRRLTIWSAGCATGEEPYTLAILLSESPHLRDWRIRILGSDLCQENVDAALRGIYRRGAFRTMRPNMLERYFTKEPDGSYRVSSELRRMCHFSRVNLMDPHQVRSVGRVDAVFCRNVLIYFDDVSRKQATDALYERLLPGGYLFLGHSESLLNSDTRFVPVHLRNDLVYQRPAISPGRWG